jgi:hypothetical protein
MYRASPKPSGAEAAAEAPRRFTSPSEPVAPHSRTPSKTTVTSANVASVGETNLCVGAAAADKPILFNASTPRRRPSFMDQPPQQLPTPRGSLHWPSTHRSFSSAAATRDSSCHSQATDPVNTTGLNVSSVTGGRGRAPSSTCRTPMSSHDEPSEHRFSDTSGTGDMRRGHSLGPHLAAPPLVDVSGCSPSQGPQSTSPSVYTTGLCTPRDNAAAAAVAAAHVRHPSPFSGHSVSAAVSVGGSRSVITPAPPPPLDDFEAEAQSLSREELEEKVEQMRGDNLVLRTSVLRLREALATLQEGMRANYADIERRQDSIANMLLRRLEATKRHRAKLVAHLRNVELEKASQEMKLHSTKQSINDLTKHLKREEQEIAGRLQGRLEKLHAQREQLNRVLEEQTSSLQQLEQLVQEVEEMGIVDGIDARASKSDEGVAAAVAAAASSTHLSSILTTADTVMSDSGSASTTAVVSAGAAVPTASTTSTAVAAAAAVPAAPLLSQVSGSGGGSTLVSCLHERSSSRVSVASSTTGTATTATTADVACDPNAMIRYLEEEIAAAESLRCEALSKADRYVATRERLERRLKREKEHKAAQQSRTEALRQELRNASSAVHEKVALQETALEMEVDRHLNNFRLGGDTSSASSACATPKLRAVSAMASRGNSISPSIGGLTLTAAGDGGGVGGTSAAAPPSDTFLLPSSSFNSTVPVSSSVGHGDVSGAASGRGTACYPTGMVVGDGGAVPRMSSSSIHINTSISRDETTASSEGTPHTMRLQVQETSRMVAPRPTTSDESTPRRTPLATPQLSMSHEPAA